MSDVCGFVVGAGASLRGQNVYSLRGLPSAGVSSRSLSLGGKKAKLESTQQRRVPSVSATIAAPGMWCIKFTEQRIKNFVSFEVPELGLTWFSNLKPTFVLCRDCAKFRGHP